MQLSNEKTQISENIFVNEDQSENQGEDLAVDVCSKVRPKKLDINLAYQPFNYEKLTKISDIDIPFFNRLTDLLAVVFPQQIKDRFNFHLETDSLKSRVVNFGDFKNSLVDDTCVIYSHCLNWNSNLLISVSRKTVEAGLNSYLNHGSLLAGTASAMGKVNNKPLSRMGEQFAQSIASCCFTSINHILAEHASLNLIPRYVESNVDKVVLVDSREKVVVCTLNTCLDGQATRQLNIVIPLLALTPFLTDLDALSHILAGQLDGQNASKNLADNIDKLSFELVATTPEELVTLHTVSNLKVGDVLPLPNFSELQIKVLDEVIYKASLGNDGAYHAGRISQVKNAIG